MSKYSLRRVLSFLLAVIMVCTLLPTAAFAEEDVEQPTAGEQTAATPDGEENPKPETPIVEEENGEKTPEEPKQDVASVQSADGLNTEISTQALSTGHKIDVTFKVLYVDSSFNIGYTYGKSENTQFVCQYKVNHSDDAYNNHTIAISDIQAAAGRASVNSGYSIVGWTKTASANPTIYGFNLKEPTACNKGTTIYLVAKKPAGPTAPATPTFGDNINGSVIVHLICSKNSGHNTDYPIDQNHVANGLCNITAPKWTASGGYTSTLTIYGDKYVADKDSGAETQHTLVGAESQTITLTYNTTTQKWTASKSEIYFTIECTEEQPQKPTDDFLQKLGSSPVRLSCTTDSISHNYYPSNMLPDSYKTGDVTEVNGVYTCTVTVYAKKYVDTYNKHNTVQHELDDVASKSFTLTYNAENKTWEVPDGNLPIRFSMKCPPQQPTIDTIKARNWKVGITCVDKTDTHVLNPLYLDSGVFTVGEMKQDEDGSYICEITVKAEKYIEVFCGSYYVGHTFHKLVDGEPSEKTFTAKFVSGNWVADDPVVTFNVTCDFMPEKPDIETLLPDKAVGIDCVTEGSNHRRERFSLIDGSYTVTDPERDANGARVCYVTVDSAPYLAEYAKNNGAHKPASAEDSKKTYRVWFNATSGKWVITLPDWTFIRFAAVCDNTPTPPEKPENPNVPEVLKDFKVTVNCSNAVAGHGSKDYALLDGSYTCSEPSLDSNSEVYRCSVTINPAKYVEQFTKDKGNVQHTLSGESSSVTLTLEHTDGAWTLSADSPTSAAFTVECETVYYSYKVVHVYRTNGEEDGRTAATTISNVVSGTVVSADSITKETTYSGNTYEFAKADPEQATISNNDVTFTLYYDRTVMCTVTYTDGVDGKAFANKTFENLLPGVGTPAFGSTPTRKDYVFGGWTPAVADKVTETVTYTATWKEDFNNNGKPDEEEERFTVTYTDGVGGQAFADQVNKDLLPDVATPAFNGTPTREGYKFTGWNPEVSATVTKDVTYTATWKSEVPEKPTKEEVEKLFDSEKFIQVRCSFRDTHTGWVACKLNEGNYEIGSVTKKGDDYYCTIELDAASYADQYHAVDHTQSHRLSPENQKHTLTLMFDRESETWTDVDARTIEITVSCARTVTYTDGVDGEEIFADQEYTVGYGDATPAFNGTHTRKNYVFAGWTPAVADKVTEDVTYTATWKEDFNNNGKPDDEEERFTVTYTDGVKGKAFKDQVFDKLLSGTDTPEFSGKPTRKGYTFTGWSPKVADTVTKDVTYTATWKAVNTSGKDKLAKTGDNGLVLVFGGLMLLSLCGAAAVCVIDRKRRHN